MPFKRRLFRRHIAAAAILALLVAIPVVLAMPGVPFSGELTSSSPTYIRPRNCSTLGASSYYDLQEFNVDAAGTYTIEITDANMDQGEVAADTFMVLYQGTFDPANPLTNCVDTNDDISGTNYLSRITQTLAAGHYIAVISGFAGEDNGPYEGFISGGPGTITLGNAPASAEEPAPGAPWNPGDGRLNPHPAAPAAIYYDSGTLKVYMLNGDAQGYEVLSMSGDEIMGLCSPTPAAHTLIASADEGHVRLYCLSTGEIQLNINHGATETAYVWDALPPSTQHTYTFDADGALLSEFFERF